MPIEKIVCQQCGAAIPWDGVATRLQCAFCGTVYERKQSKKSVKRYLDESGNEFLVGYYPPMFNGAYQIRNMGNNMSLNSREIPLKVFYEMSSEEGNAHILYISGTMFHHIDDTPVNANRQNMFGNDLKRYRSYVGADAYADIRFAEEHPGAKDVRVIRIEEPCEKSKESLDKLRIRNQNNPGVKYDNEFVGKIYSYEEDEKRQNCLIRLALESREVPTISNMVGKLFGALGSAMAGLSGASRNITWTVFNEMFFWGTEEGVTKYWSEFEKVYETIQLGPDFVRMTNEINSMFMRTEQVIANNNMQMANAQMQSSQRMGDMINSTYAYGMELDRQSWADTNATMDRVGAMRSEAIRGVNSFSTGGGEYVEADVRFDSVYQNNNDSGVYAGVEGDFDMGSEWTMLKKRF